MIVALQSSEDVGPNEGSLSSDGYQDFERQSSTDSIQTLTSESSEDRAFQPDEEGKEGIIWELSPFDLVEWNSEFETIDTDKDAFISEDEVLAVFTAQHFNPNDIKKICALSDVDGDHKFNFDEYSIARFLLKAKQRGYKVPKQLPDDWLPKKNHRSINNNGTHKPHLNGNSNGRQIRSNSAVQDDSRSNSTSLPRKSIGSVSEASRMLRNWSTSALQEIGKMNTDQLLTSMNMTRPSFLPPKNKAESVKHAKEAEKIQKKIKQQLVSEEKIQQKKELTKLEKDRRMHQMKLFWEDILSTWPQKRSHPKTIKMWWKGFPPSVRGSMWELAIPNNLNITPELYTIFKTHAQNAREKKRGMLGREDTVVLIPLDLPRTFPGLAFFQPDGPCHPQLREVLEAYTCYRPDIGYVQGMSYLAAMLLLNMPPYPAFKCLANLLNGHCYISFFRMETNDMEKYMNAYEIALAHALPKLYSHMTELGIQHTAYLVDWVMTIYTKSMPLDIATKIWDIYLLECDSFIFRTAIGILRMFSQTLEKSSFDDIMRFLGKIPEDLDEELLFSNIEKVELTPQQFAKYLTEKPTKSNFTVL